jgi:hypothetical protein
VAEKKPASNLYEPLTDFEQRLVAKLALEFPKELFSRIREKLEIDSPRLLISELSGTKGEAWREVGATGQPAFQNSWVNAAGGETAAFYKDALGIVHLKGFIGSGTINAVAFTLPEGYRPAANLQFAAPSNSAFGYFDVQSDGDVLPVVGNNTWFALNVSFRAA